MLEKAKESSKEVDKIMEELRSTIDVLKHDESTLTQQIDSMRRELSELEDKRARVSAENDKL